MHLAMRPKPDLVVEGSRFAVRTTRETLAVEPVRENFTILTAEAGEPVLRAVDAHGQVWTTVDRACFVADDGRTGVLAWTLPLPESIDPSDYVAAHLHPRQPFPRRTGTPPFLMFVRKVEDGVAYCAALAQQGGRVSSQWPDDVRIVDAGFLPGDLLAAASLEQDRDDDGAIFTLYQHGLIARGIKGDDFSTVLPAQPEDGLRYAVYADWEHAFAVARQAGRPEECVVLFENSCLTMLSKSGVQIARLDHPRYPREWKVDAALAGESRADGVWVFADVEFQMDYDPEGFPDFHWDGELKPATEADLLRHGLEPGLLTSFASQAPGTGVPHVT